MAQLFLQTWEKGGDTLASQAVLTQEADPAVLEIDSAIGSTNDSPNNSSNNSPNNSKTRPKSRPIINPWVIALTVTLATFMELLDTSIANVSLPSIARALRRSYTPIPPIPTPSL